MSASGLGNPTWSPGVSGNPAGRPKGSRNKRTTDMFDLLESRGDIVPIDFLSNYIKNGTDDGLKVQAANIVAPYKHSKQSTTPAPRFVPEPITVPIFTSIEEAEAYFASLPVLLGKGELDSQTALELSQLIRNWISAKFDHEELQLKIQAHGGTGPTTIRIFGGLPSLPGTNITMPILNNWHEINGEVIAVLDGPAQPPPQTESFSPPTEQQDGHGS
jgi:hypothetical protein